MSASNTSLEEPAAVQPTTAGGSIAALALDARSLAVFRMAVAVVLLANLCELWPDIPSFFTDAGTLPREALKHLNRSEVAAMPPYWVSLHLWSDALWFQKLLFLASAFAASLLLLGYCTPWATCISWGLLCGLQARNPLIMHGGDDVLRVMLFWSIFLPLGRRWSIDAWLQHATDELAASPQSPQRNSVMSLAAMAFSLQLAIMYVETALLKTDPMWRIDLSALHYALHSDHMTTALGYRLAGFPWVTRVLTAATMLLELFGPVLLFYPCGDWRWRMSIIAGFWGLHLGILATFALGLFPVTCLVCWAALIPGGAWESAASLRLGCWGREKTALWLTSLRRRLDAARRALRNRIPASCPGELSVGGNCLLAALLGYVLLLNAVRLRGTILAPGPLRILGEAAQLNQHWCMFAPRANEFGGWMNFQGKLADGARVNLLHPDSPVQERAPTLTSADYPSMRWRKCVLSLIERNCPTHRRAFADFLRRRWQAAHPSQQEIVELDLLCMRSPTPAPGEPRSTTAAVTVDSESLWHWSALESAPHSLVSSAAGRGGQ